MFAHTVSEFPLASWKSSRYSEQARKRMPIYEYIAAEKGEGCRVCSNGFELRRPLNRPALEKCPLCRAPVKKLISTGVTSPNLTAPLSVSDAKKAGFTVLEKRDQGVYEKL